MYLPGLLYTPAEARTEKVDGGLSLGELVLESWRRKCRDRGADGGGGEGGGDGAIVAARKCEGRKLAASIAPPLFSLFLYEKNKMVTAKMQSTRVKIKGLSFPPGWETPVSTIAICGSYYALFW